MDLNSDVTADEFWNSEVNVSLSHQKRVELPCSKTCPKHGNQREKCKLLNRAEVVLARGLIRKASSAGIENFGEKDIIEFLEAEQVHVGQVPCKHMIHGLRKLVQRLKPGEGVDEIGFVDFLRLICPCALPKHLHMFESWCHAYDECEKQEDELSALIQSEKVFDANELKPILPQDEFLRMQKEFNDLDYDGSGFIEVEELSKMWGVSLEVAFAAMDKFDYSQDRCIDMQEFLMMTCPPTYRLPNMCGVGREIFGQLLKSEIKNKRDRVKTQRSNFSVEFEQDNKMISPPSSLLPLVQQEDLKAWLCIFEQFDKDQNGTVELSELQASGVLAPEVCSTIMKLVDKTNAGMFFKETFICAMCRVHGVRRTMTDRMESRS